MARVHSNELLLKDGNTYENTYCHTLTLLQSLSTTCNKTAYIMAKHADPAIPDTPEEWLEQFNTFSIYQVLPQLIELGALHRLNQRYVCRKQK